MSSKDGDVALSSNGKELKFWGKAVVNVFGSVVFIYKVTRVGACEFSIDRAGFLRKSKMGEKFIPWEQVINVHSLSESYLLELEQGSIPLPYRCFESNERKIFENYVTEKLRK